MIEILTAFGIGNVITVLIVGTSVVFNYATMKSRINAIDEKLDDEITERKAENVAIRYENNNFFGRNEEQHQALINEISGMRKDLTFHLGVHKGKEE